MKSRGFPDALLSYGPARDRGDNLALYGRFVGDWDMEVVAHDEKGGRHTGKGEIHFGWVLEGRAVQDVWIITDTGTPLPGAGNWYGTTLRIYDPQIDAWRIFWNDPKTLFFANQIGRARGADIVQEGRHEKNGMMRWSFTEITERSFHWLGEHSLDDGKTWRLQVEVFARRTKA